jgi:hypothetical protein
LVGGQAIGSDVAAETRRSAETKVPARTVATSRAEAKEANIDIPLGILFGRPDHRADAIINAGAVPIEKNRYFSVAATARQKNSPASNAASW